MVTVVQDHEIRDFREFVEDAGMTELKGISKWIVDEQDASYSSSCSRTIFSDHSSLCVELGRQEKATIRPFRFMNCLAYDPNFGKIVADNWQINTNALYMKKVWLKLKHMKQAMKGLNVKEYSGVANKIKGIRNDLQILQQQMRTPNQDPHKFEVEKELRLQLEKWDVIKESIYKQKSRVEWRKLGDSNSAYFFASIKNRRAQDQIKALTNAVGDIVQTEKRIE
ncbi:PREDICTED: uncharacterized protein LOC109215257 [Nicotiana attenuata]|uniref:uncharacterized protein LOC109215257 n=1 Tax=Nicotiana attenuata TaxID=49451 RepID=UPI0009059DEC|nr:PREDICTED: uncharacterized protein LOC109215257 [Nicotiana attenuata]